MVYNGYVRIPEQGPMVLILDAIPAGFSRKHRVQVDDFTHLMGVHLESHKDELSLRAGLRAGTVHRGNQPSPMS